MGSECLHTYRLLRQEENPSEGLYPKDASDRSFSVNEHIVHGSRRSTRFVSASRDPRACLFYASKSIHKYGIHPDNHRVVEMLLDLSKGGVWDLSAKKQRADLGIEEKSQADNYANAFGEVIIDRHIEPYEILRVHSVPKNLPAPTNFESFKSELDQVSAQSEWKKGR